MPFWHDFKQKGYMTICLDADRQEREGISSYQEKSPSWFKNPLYALGKSLIDFVYPMSPVTHRREFHLIPFVLENFMGSALYPAYILQSGGEVGPRYQWYVAMVQQVGQRLAAKSPRKGLKFEFTVVNDWSLNAWCLPGGKIGINIGLLQALERETRDFGLSSKVSFEDRVASVLSHEITHASARHYGRTLEFKIFLTSLLKMSTYFISYLVNQHFNYKLSQLPPQAERDKAKISQDKIYYLQKVQSIFNAGARIVTSGLGLCNSRSHELEADKYGMHLLYKCGIELQSALWLQHFFIHYPSHSNKGFFAWLSHLTSTHPSSQERLKANQQTLQELQN